METVEEVTKKRSQEGGRDSVQGTGHGCRILQEGRVCVRLPPLRSCVCVFVCVSVCVCVSATATQENRGSRLGICLGYKVNSRVCGDGLLD